MEPFKNIYNKKSIAILAENIKKNHKDFNDKDFLKSAIKDINKLEMKERVVQISLSLKKFLPSRYSKAVKILINMLTKNKNDVSNMRAKDVSGFLVWPISHFVETYGGEDFEISMDALYEVTKAFTAEFGIRKFIQINDKKIFEYINVWKNDRNHHVRRLCSEGIRPNLPWGMKVEAVNNDLKRNIKILDNLKNDSEEYVRRSVANHLNDISRLDQKLFMKTCKRWLKEKELSEKQKENLNWIIRHASRSLLKMGDVEVLKLHGYKANENIKLSKQSLSNLKIKEGDSAELSVDLVFRQGLSKGSTKKPVKILLHYVIYYLKNNGEYSEKVFSWKEISPEFNKKITLRKKVNFKKVSTRKHYSGKHFIAIRVNGVESKKTEFSLKV